MTYIVNGNILLVEKNDEFKEHIINEGIKALSVLNKPIQNGSLTAPPTSPNHDDFYIVAATATGLWAGKENKIAYPATDSAGAITGWNFYEPENGTYAYLLGVGLRLFNGTVWIDLLQPVIPFLALTDTPNSYASQSLKLVQVASDESGLVFLSPNLKETISGQIQAPTAMTYTLELSAKRPYTIKVLNHKLDAETATFSVQINGTNVAGLASLSGTTSLGTATATAANSVAIGNTVDLVVSAVSTSPAASNLRFTLELEYTAI
jgi:hypothetical protein